MADIIKHRENQEKLSKEKVEKLEKARKDKIDEENKKVELAYEKINGIHKTKGTATDLQINVEKLKMDAKVAKMKELLEN